MWRTTNSKETLHCTVFSFYDTIFSGMFRCKNYLQKVLTWMNSGVSSAVSCERLSDIECRQAYCNRQTNVWLTSHRSSSKRWKALCASSARWWSFGERVKSMENSSLAAYLTWHCWLKLGLWWFCFLFRGIFHGLKASVLSESGKALISSTFCPKKLFKQLSLLP